ncbi:MAG: hypothetical protein S4CHLAM81_04380 [Chlamydiales bacterium]|nr:hypothetical protein [Chlamydiales bacterium]MCH9635227.1 hypothetical protein [Chlamydiales bacterium]MCH9703838.1 DUF687 domain-containing protein [Chlamydiota bacterium]
MKRLILSLLISSHLFAVQSYHTVEVGSKSKSTEYNLSDYDVISEPHIGIGMVNGIDNTLDEAIEAALMLSALAGGYDIWGVYNSTQSLPLDVFESLLNLWEVSTEPVTYLQDTWKRFFDEAPEGSIFLQFCHSQGAILTRNALMRSSQDLRERVRVVAVAPGAYIDEHLCHSVQHYRVEGGYDWIPHLDSNGMYRNRHTTKVLKSVTKDWDHTFLSPTYQEALEHEIQSYLSLNSTTELAENR